MGEPFRELKFRAKNNKKKQSKIDVQIQPASCDIPALNGWQCTLYPEFVYSLVVFELCSRSLAINISHKKAGK